LLWRCTLSLKGCSPLLLPCKHVAMYIQDCLSKTLVLAPCPAVTLSLLHPVCMLALWCSRLTPFMPRHSGTAAAPPSQREQSSACNEHRAPRRERLRAASTCVACLPSLRPCLPACLSVRSAATAAAAARPRQARLRAAACMGARPQAGAGVGERAWERTVPARAPGAARTGGRLSTARRPGGSTTRASLATSSAPAPPWPCAHACAQGRAARHMQL
jgi:hypothetical protein